MKKNGSKGFTLIELIMVMVLVGIMAVVAVPMFQNLPQTRAQVAAFKLRSDLRYIQMLSIQSQLLTRALFNTATQSYQLQIQNGTPGNWAVVKKPGTLADYTVELNAGDFQGVTISQVNFNGTQAVIFDRLGIPFDNSNIALADPAFVTFNGQYQIHVAGVTGKIDVVML